jgi:hypothetical protein
VIHSEGKRDTQNERVVIPSQACNDFSVKTTQVPVVQKHRRSNKRHLMWISSLQNGNHRIEQPRIKIQKKIISLMLAFLLLCMVVIAALCIDTPDSVEPLESISSDTVWTVYDVPIGECVFEASSDSKESSDEPAPVYALLTKEKDMFALDTEPRFTFEYRNDKVPKRYNVGAEFAPVLTKPAGMKKWGDEKKILETSVYDSQGMLTNIKPEVEEAKDGSFSITLPTTKGVRPGFYTLDVALIKDNVTYREQEEFMWGLVSLNTKKSIYKPGEVAEFILVLLDKDGHSVSGGDIDLHVTDCANKTVYLSTSNGTITPSEDCGIYSADCRTEREGEHRIDVTALIDDVPVTFSTYFLVLEDYDFDIQRTAKSKIDPTKEISFDVVVEVESFVDVGSLMIQECVPADFEIGSTDATVITEDSNKILTWGRNLTGNKTSVRYSYSVPHIWPYLYALGPVGVQYGSQTFKEARPWFVAVDPVIIPTVTTNTSTGLEETNATLWGYMTDDGGEACTVRFEYGTTTAYGTNTSNQTKSNDSVFSADISSLTKGQLYHYQAYANNTAGGDTGDDFKFLTKPDAPSSLTTQVNNSSVLYLTWTKGTGANCTYIERSTNSVWTRGVGTEVYNNTGTWYEDTGCDENMTYYYQAWSYTTWTYDSTIHQWSDANTTANDRTDALPTIATPGPANGGTGIGLTPLMNITVHDFDDGSLTVRWYSNSSGSWALFGINSSVGNGTYRWTNSNFSGYATRYWWNVSVSDGQDVNESSVFHFTTIEADISLGITPSTWDQGTILIGGSNATTGSYYNLTNQGEVPIIVQIKATNATNATTGAKWNLTGSSGFDNFSLQYNKSGDVSWTTINLTYDTFVLNLPATGTNWKTFDLKLIMATRSSTGDPLSFSITFKSIAA